MKCVSFEVQRAEGFTLIELLVVISIISLLMGIVVSALSVARGKGKQIVCCSNIRQLALANIGYAGDNDGFYVLAAYDVFVENEHRWYGRRGSVSYEFDVSRGPLKSFLGGGEMRCPRKVNFMKLDTSDAGYDEGAGGYGYNMVYIGSRIWEVGYEDEYCRLATRDSEVKKPAETLMFADSAMIRDGHYIECSFAEPRYFVVNREPVFNSGWQPLPTIHFRHRGQGNVAWVDGHVTSEKIATNDELNAEGMRSANYNVGWFEPIDNSLFDLN